MKTLRIFFRLKCEEIGEWWHINNDEIGQFIRTISIICAGSWILGATILLILHKYNFQFFMELLGDDSTIVNAICLPLAVALILISAVFIIGFICWVIYRILKWLWSNWKEARRLAKQVT